MSNRRINCIKSACRLPFSLILGNATLCWDCNVTLRGQIQAFLKSAAWGRPPPQTGTRLFYHWHPRCSGANCGHQFFLNASAIIHRNIPAISGPCGSLGSSNSSSNFLQHWPGESDPPEFCSPFRILSPPRINQHNPSSANKTNESKPE